MEENAPQPQIHQPTYGHAKPPKKTGRTVLVSLIIIILIAGAAGAGYWYGTQQADKTISQKNSEIAALKSENDDLKKQLSEEDVAVVTSLPTKEAIDEIQANLASKEYSKLSSYLSDNVVVILAASEGLGVRSKTQVPEDLKILSTATAPWDFGLPQATIDQYKKGDYAQYIPDGAIIGKSKDNKVVVVGFNGSGKINSIFYSADAKLLE